MANKVIQSQFCQCLSLKIEKIEIFIPLPSYEKNSGITLRYF